MVKTITIREDVYRRLLAVKREGESFSKLLERLIEETDPTDILVRLRGCVEIKDKGRLLSEIYLHRAERRT